MQNVPNPAVSTSSPRRVRLMWAFATLALIAGALLMAGRAHAQSIGFSLAAVPVAGANPDDVSVLVLDDLTGAPLADATVILGDSLQDEGNRGQTGTQGTYVAQGQLARGPRTLTVAREGYATLSLTGLQSPQVTLYLKALPQPSVLGTDPTVMASGEMASWPGVGDGDSVTAGIALPALSALDLLHFSTESFISPLKDTIDVFGSHQIPSNFLIPDQDIPVLFASVHVSKPTFRLPVTRGRELRLASVQGTIAVGDIVSLAQGGGKISMDLLNKLSFTHAGVTDATRPDSDFHVTLDANQALSPRYQVSPSAPPFAADVLVAALTDLDGSRKVLMPTDIKLAASQSDPSQVQGVTLVGPDSSVGAAHDVLTAAMADKGRRVSGILSDGANGSVSPGDYLPAQALDDSATLPDSIPLAPLATGLAAAVYESQGTAVWYVYALPGSDQAAVIPSKRLAEPAKITGYSVMSLDFGAGFDARNLDGQGIMARLVRFARSTAKIGAPAPTP